MESPKNPATVQNSQPQGQLARFPVVNDQKLNHMKDKASPLRLVRLEVCERFKPLSCP